MPLVFLNNLDVFLPSTLAAAASGLAFLTIYSGELLLFSLLSLAFMV